MISPISTSKKKKKQSSEIFTDYLQKLWSLILYIENVISTMLQTLKKKNENGIKVEQLFNLLIKHLMKLNDLWLKFSYC